MAIYTNRLYAYDVQGRTVAVSGRLLKSPMGNGAAMADVNDAAFALLLHALDGRQARALFAAFGLVLSLRAASGKRVISMTADEIKTWASAARLAGV